MNCINCKKVILNKRKGSKFCSDNCKSQYHYWKKKELNENNNLSKQLEEIKKFGISVENEIEIQLKSKAKKDIISIQNLFRTFLPFNFLCSETRKVGKFYICECMIKK